MLLFTIASSVFLGEASLIVIALTGTAEIVEETVNSLLLTHLILAAIATVDAYFSAKR